MAFYARRAHKHTTLYSLHGGEGVLFFVDGVGDGGALVLGVKGVVCCEGNKCFSENYPH